MAEKSASAAPDKEPWFKAAHTNPSSKKRHDYLKRACDLILQHQSPETVCGLVENIGREGELAKLLTLAQLREETVNMFTTVFIGNSQTCMIDGKMVTPRGYRDV